MDLRASPPRQWAAHGVRALVAPGHHGSRRPRAYAGVATRTVCAAAAPTAVEARTPKRRPAEPAALDARDRALSRRPRISAGPRDRVDVGTRRRAGAEHAEGV